MYLELEFNWPTVPNVLSVNLQDKSCCCRGITEQHEGAEECNFNNQQISCSSVVKTFHFPFYCIVPEKLQFCSGWGTSVLDGARYQKQLSWFRDKLLSRTSSSTSCTPPTLPTGNHSSHSSRTLVEIGSMIKHFQSGKWKGRAKVRLR